MILADGACAAAVCWCRAHCTNRNAPFCRPK